MESAYCGASARSALVLGQARGVVLAAAARAGLPVCEYAPAEVKRAFTGSGAAGKQQMMRTAWMLLGFEAERMTQQQRCTANCGIRIRDAAPGNVRCRTVDRLV